MAFVHDKVWDLLQQTRAAMRDVGKFYGGGHPDRTRLERPQVDYRVGRAIVPAPGVESRAILGADAHDALKDLVAPSAAKRFSRWRGGPERAEQEAHDNHAVRQSALIDSVRMVAELSESRSYANADPAPEDVEYGALQEAVGGAWTAAHFDRVVERLEGFGHLPPGTAEQVALGWDEADRQQILDRVHPQAPSGYAFAEEVGKQAGMSTDRTLHWLNNAPPHVAPGVAADLLMRGSDALQTLAEQNPVEYARFKGDLGENIRENFEELNHTLDSHEARTVSVDHATQASNGGRRIADSALALIAAKEAELTSAAGPAPVARDAAVEFDPRIGSADATRATADPPHSPTDRTGRTARSAGAANALSPQVGE
ncbi:hypothetical protein [Kribbella speibonae]|uniref:Uncharacterized protein n=1 Tax=Kribbella speibonae TaxID=1572660 RepID=A0ABY2AGC9_9ACTN|nr:hypothetical protein [Kribbella speibonae]TCC27526.1 hypothetical protein E0H58_06095 [Kribbella speibonae]